MPDDENEIRLCVREWAEQEVANWIITTGGTGFGVRDRTPEVRTICSSTNVKDIANTCEQAIKPLLEREAPGIVHLLLASSLQKTPFAALSRPVAGTYLNSLITTLPGSVKAVKENLEALLQSGVVDHAIDLIKGGSGKTVHAGLASSTPHSSASSLPPSHSHGHHHHHHHHHGNPSGHTVPVPRTTLSHDPSAPGKRVLGKRRRCR